MIGTKLSAYRIIDGEWESVNRWKLVKLPDTEYRKFKEKYFPLYLYKSEESPRLTFNRSQKTFRFLPNQGLGEWHSSSGMRVEHQLAQEVISNLRYLHLKVRDKRTRPYKDIEYDIEVDNAILEQKLDIDKNRYFIDILIFFSKPYELSLKWNGVLALEIYVTKSTHGQKIIDFEKKKVPLIEVYIGPKLRLNKAAKDTSEIEEENLRKVLENVFRKQIFGSLHVSPTSNRYKENKVIKEYSDRINEFNSEQEKLRESYMMILNEKKNLTISLIRQQNNNHEKDYLINTLREEIKEKNDIINSMNNKPFFRKLIELIK